MLARLVKRSKDEFLKVLNFVNLERIRQTPKIQNNVRGPVRSHIPLRT